ncbi:hypothetical protein AgCh_016314 [Apium graveolens]
MDSGATNHMTNEFYALGRPTEYEGTDQIRVVNGSSQPISHVGTSSISDSLCSFLLRDVFYVPNVSSNLLSVSQFARDNNVYFKFHPTYFLVKDRQLERVVLQDKNKDGLYMFDDATVTTSSSYSTLIGLNWKSVLILKSELKISELKLSELKISEDIHQKIISGLKKTFR